MPGAVDGNSGEGLGAAAVRAIRGILAPGGVVRERGEHMHIVSALRQEFAEGGVAGGYAGEFGRVIDSPNGDSHLGPGGRAAVWWRRFFSSNVLMTHNCS